MSKILEFSDEMSRLDLKEVILDEDRRKSP